jgi:glycosyltransferase involved in cell wall biosynthesis
MTASESPAVSVIVPAYKVTEYIGETLESLRAQTFRNFETVVINDGCPDTENLERVLEPYRGEIVYLKKTNGGLASARNAGIEASRAPLVALLDSDDVWEPEYLAVQTRMLADHPEADVVYPNATFFGETPFAGKTVQQMYPSRGDVTLQSLLSGECKVFVGVTARKEAFIRAGLFDASLRSAEDLDLWLRLAKMGARFIYHGQALVRYRSRPTNLSNDTIWMSRHVLHVYRKLLAQLDLTAEERDALKAAIRGQQATLDFCLGKKALYGGEFGEARERLALVALHCAPGLLHRYVHKRHPTEYSFMH